MLFNSPTGSGTGAGAGAGSSRPLTTVRPSSKIRHFRRTTVRPSSPIRPTAARRFFRFADTKTPRRNFSYDGRHNIAPSSRRAVLNRGPPAPPSGSALRDDSASACRRVRGCPPRMDCSQSSHAAQAFRPRKRRETELSQRRRKRAILAVPVGDKLNVVRILAEPPVREILRTVRPQRDQSQHAVSAKTLLQLLTFIFCKKSTDKRMSAIITAHSRQRGLRAPSATLRHAREQRFRRGYDALYVRRRAEIA